MKIALLLFAFVLIGSINVSMQGRYDPDPETGCPGGYEELTFICSKQLKQGQGDRGQRKGASKGECKRICTDARIYVRNEGHCGDNGFCCCKIKY